MILNHRSSPAREMGRSRGNPEYSTPVGRGELHFGLQGTKTGAQFTPVVLGVGSTSTEPGVGGASGSGGANALGGGSGEAGGGSGEAGGGSGEAGGASVGGQEQGGEAGSEGGSGSLDRDMVWISVPDQVWVDEVVLGANDHIELGDNAEAPPEPLANAVLSSAGPSTTELKAGAWVGDLFAAGTVSVRNEATVAGSLVAPVLDSSNGIVPVWEETTPSFRTLKHRVSVPSTLPATSLSIESTTALPPGEYGDVSVKAGGSLFVDPGRYFFRSLTMEPQSWLAASGTSGISQVYVTEQFTFRGWQADSFWSNLSIGQRLKVTVLGEQQVLLDAAFRGAVIAPRARLTLDNQGIHRGQFFAKVIELKSGAKVEKDVFPEGLADPDEGDCPWDSASGISCSADVKVFAHDTSKLEASQGQYLFQVRRSSCAYSKEACTLLPYAKLKIPEGSDSNEWKSDARVFRSPEIWYAFTIEQPDTAQWEQLLEFFVRERTSQSNIQEVAVFAEDGVTRYPDFLFSKESVTLGTDNWTVWRFDGYPPLSVAGQIAQAGPEGQRLLVRVLLKPGSIATELAAGWTTSLLWLYGAGEGGEPCYLKVEDTQEVGCDEPWIHLEACHYASSGEKSCQGFPTLSKEAKEGIEFDSCFDENESHEWTERFFPGLAARGVTHPNGVSFETIPALGFTGELSFWVVEDDREYDEHKHYTYNKYDVDPFPLATTFRSKGKKLIWDNTVDDGVYKLGKCNMSRYLHRAHCNEGSDCRSEFVCRGGTCIQP